MSNSLFINRKQDLSTLQRWLNEEQQGQSKVLLITAPSGVGKTELVKKALTSYVAMPVIDVQIVDHPTFVPAEGEYLEYMLNALVSTSKSDKRIDSIEKFVSTREGLALGKRAFSALIEYLGNRYAGEETVKQIKSILNADVSTGKHLEVRIPEIVKDQLLIYASQVFSSSPCVIRIENIQKIDKYSLEYLKKFFIQYPGLVGILEYTEHQTNTIDSEIIRAAIETPETSYKSYHLKRIPPEELIDGLKDRPDILLSALIKHYDAQNGNLRVIIDMQIIAESHSENTNLDETSAATSQVSSTTRALRSMENDKHFLLAMIMSHGSQVDEDILIAALSNQEQSIAFLQSLGSLDIRGKLDDLCQIGYLKRYDGSVKISHDSVTIAYLSDQSYKKYQIIANDVWKQFYRAFLDENDPFVPRIEALYWLAIFYLAADQIEQLIWVLEQCGHAALKSFSPKRLVSLFERITRYTVESIAPISIERLTILIERQAAILYDACWIDETCACLEQIKVRSLAAELIYADACIATNRFERGFEILDELDALYSGTDHKARSIRLRTGLIRLHGLRSDGNLTGCEELFRYLLSWDDFREDKVFACVLRYVDVGLYKDAHMEECIELLSQSIELCKKSSLLADEAAARLALCQYLGYQGNLIHARKELEAVAALADRVWISRYAILNNNAVLDLLEGNSFVEADKALATALMLATEDGDRILLLSNQLATGNPWAANQLSRLVESIPDLSAELSKIAHFNLSVHYSEQSNPLLADYHLKKASTLPDEMDEEFWECALRGKQPVSDGVRLRLSKKYYLVFIVYWRLTSETFQSIND